MESFLRIQQAAKAKHEQKQQEKAASSSKVATVPWVEKYRPRSVDDVAFQDEVVSVLKKTVEGADLPNLLFCGPPGTGKTSTILAVARQLFGDMMKSRVLELNASDERGIQVVRDKVKKFSQLAASGTRVDGKPCPPYKIVILDEADSMTGSAQSALRRTMEQQTKTTRFCLICNYVSRIIEPITSRCAKFRFKPLSREILQQRLNEICEKENVKTDKEAIEELVKVSEGDLRKAITYLQSAHRLKGEDGISAQDVLDISGVISEEIIENLIKVCHTNSYDKLETAVKDLRADGYSASQVIHQLHDKLVIDPDLNDKQKAAVCEKLAMVDKCLSDGADEYLQMLDLCSLMMSQYCQ